MIKKDVSRRGFLKRIFQTAGGVGLATAFKLVPEAKEVLADESVNPHYDATPLSKSQTEILRQQSLSDLNCRILSEHLATEGFEEIPNLYFGYRADIKGIDENGKNFRTQMDHLIIGCLNQTDNKGAMLWFAMDRNSRQSQWQIPFTVIQDGSISYVKNEQITIYDRESRLTSASWFADIINKNSPVQSKSLTPLLDHGPCSRIVDTCYIAAGSCVTAGVCCGVTLLCCIPTILVCGGTIVPCLLAGDCCRNNPGTHDCEGY